MKKYFKPLAIVLILSSVFVSCKKEVIVSSETNDFQGQSSVTIDGDKMEVVNADAAQQELPVEVINFISKYFGDTVIHTYEIESSVLGGKSYEVTFQNGASVEFDDKGNWKEVSHPSGINNELVPSMIVDFVKKNHPNILMKKISKEKKEIEVELTNGVELIFSDTGNFLRIE